MRSSMMICCPQTEKEEEKGGGGEQENSFSSKLSVVANKTTCTYTFNCLGTNLNSTKVSNKKKDGKKEKCVLNMQVLKKIARANSFGYPYIIKKNNSVCSNLCGPETQRNGTLVEKRNTLFDSESSVLMEYVFAVSMYCQ